MSPSLKRNIALIGLILALGAVLLPRFWEDATAPQAGAKGMGGPSNNKNAAIPVKIIVVKPAPLTGNLLATGTLIADEAVDLHPEMSGVVKEIGFKEGTAVSKGQILVKLKADDILAQIEKVELNLKLAQINEGRLKYLLDKEAISKQEFDMAQTNVLTLKADIQNLKAQLDKSMIRAPFSGTIGLKNISLGTYVTPQTIIGRLVQANPIKLLCAIPGRYADRIKAGQLLKFRSESNPEPYTAQIFAIEPSLDENDRTLEIKATCPNPNHILLPGAFVSVIIPLEKKGNAIKVPTECIVPEVDKQMIWRIVKGLAQPTPVITGLRETSTVEIQEGLNPNDSIVVMGVQALKPMAKVEIIP